MGLRALLRSSRSAAMVTLPPDLCRDEALLERLMWATDGVIELEGFGCACPARLTDVGFRRDADAAHFIVTQPTQHCPTSSRTTTGSSTFTGPSTFTRSLRHRSSSRRSSEAGAGRTTWRSSRSARPSLSRRSTSTSRAVSASGGRRPHPLSRPQLTRTTMPGTRITTRNLLGMRAQRVRPAAGGCGSRCPSWRRRSTCLSVRGRPSRRRHGRSSRP